MIASPLAAPRHVPESFAAPHAVVSQLLQDARALLERDQDAALRTLAQASRLLGAREAAAQPVQGGLANWQMQRLIRYIAANLDGQILQRHLAQEVRLSSGHFARVFKQSFGCTAHTYVMERRIEHAKTLMTRTRSPLCEIALACGLADQAHLSRVFRRVTGQTPLSWRRQHQAAPQ